MRFDLLLEQGTVVLCLWSCSKQLETGEQEACWMFMVIAERHEASGEENIMILR
jgi:hypothetical protein